MISVEAVKTLSSFAGTEAFWNRLAAQSDNFTPFMSFEWFSFFWPKFCAENEPIVLVINENSRPAGIVPLWRKKIRWRGLPVTCLRFLANYFSIRTGIICPAPDRGNLFEPAFRFLKESRIGFDLFCADLIVKDSATDTMLRQYVRERSLGCFCLPGESNPFVLIKGGWEEYLMARSKHQRFNVRHLDKLYERGVNYRISSFTGQGLEEAAEKMFFVSRNSWKFSEGTAICNDPVKMDFYRDFLRVAAGAGWLQLKIMEIDAVPAAFSYELKHDNKLYILKIGFNNDFRKLAPGAFLMNRSIREAFAAGMRECELLGSAEEWKLKMCDGSREHVKYWVFNDSAYGRFLYAWEKSVVAAAKNLLPRQRLSAKYMIAPTNTKNQQTQIK